MLSRFLLLIITCMLILLHWQALIKISPPKIITSVCASSDEKDDEKLSNEFSVLTGQVTTMNAETKEVEAPGSRALIFQRIDCKKCILQTRTDIKGRYEVIVGKGKYRVIARDGTRIGETYDLLAPSQPRIVEVKASSIYTHFDINLVRRPSPLERNQAPIIRNPE